MPTLPRWLDEWQRGGVLATAVMLSAGYATVGLALLLLTVGIEAVVSRRIPWQRSALDVPLLAFLSVFLIAGWLSPYRAVATGSVGLAAVSIYLAYGVAYRVMRRDAALLAPLLWAWVGGGMAAALWAIGLHWSTGLPAFVPELGKNAVGTTLLLAILMALGLYAVSRPPWRYLMLAAGPALAVGMLLTYARGAWLGSIVGLAAFFALAEFGRRWRALAFVAVLGVFAAAGASTERSVLAERALTIPSIGANAPRVYLLRSSLAMIADYPVLGTGLNTFATRYPHYRLPGDPNLDAVPFAHNIFLNMMVEGGPPGLAAFAAIIVVGLVAGWRWYRRGAGLQDATLRAAVLAAFIGMMVHQQVDGTLLSVHLGTALWFLLAVMTGHSIG